MKIQNPFWESFPFTPDLKLRVAEDNRKYCGKCGLKILKGTKYNWTRRDYICASCIHKIAKSVTKEEVKFLDSERDKIPIIEVVEVLS